MEEPRRREENGKVYVDIVETKTYEEKVIKAPFGFTKTIRVEVKPKDSKAEDAPEKKKLTKKQKLGIGGLLLAGLIGGAAIKRHHDAEVEDDEEYDDEYVDEENEDDTEDSED